MPSAIERVDQSNSIKSRQSGSGLRLLFLIDEIPSLDCGGTERQVLQMIRSSQRLGHEPRLAVLRGSEWLTPDTAGCPVYSARAWGLFRPSGWRGCAALVRWMRREKIDLVQTFFVECNVIGPWLARLAGVPIVIGTRRNLDQWEGMVHWWNPLMRLIQRIAFCSADSVVVNSEMVFEMMAATRQAPRHKLRIRYNGIDLAEFSDLSKLRADARQSMGVGEDEVLVGNISGLRRVKGLLQFVDAARLAAEKNKNLQFVIVGGGEQQAEIVSRIRDYKLSDRIHLAGPKDNVLPYLAAMDIGVLSSLAEGFSNSLLEYMAAGLPAIATDVGGNREALGDSGILIPPDDPQALANAILELCSPELRDRLGKAARARVERFGLERAEERLGEIYEEFVRSRSVGPGGLVVREDLPMDENRPQWPGK